MEMSYRYFKMKLYSHRFIWGQRFKSNAFKAENKAKKEGEKGSDIVMWATVHLSHLS